MINSISMNSMNSTMSMMRSGAKQQPPPPPDKNVFQVADTDSDGLVSKTELETLVKGIEEVTGNSMDVDEALSSLICQVARALHYAHSQGALYRDIKPSNLLLDPLGVAWVVDFGLAKVTSSETLTMGTDLTGTMRYMAPEHFNGLNDARSDIYSLGLTLYF